MFQHYAYTPYIWFLLFSAGITAWIAWRALREKNHAVDSFFAILMVGVSFWALCYAFEIAAIDLPTKLFWSKLKYLGVAVIGPAWLAFALHYTHNYDWLKRPWLRFLIALELLSPISVFTNSWHHAWWSAVEFTSSGPFPDLVTTWGPLFWMHTALAYSFLLGGLAPLVKFYQTTQALYRRQVMIVIGAMLIPLVGNSFYLSGVLPLPPSLDITPFLLAITGLLLAYALYRYQLLALTPIARRHVIENMLDGVIVEDKDQRIVDINPSALRILGQKSTAVIGQPLAEIVDDPELAAALLQESYSETEGQKSHEVLYEIEGREHIFDVSVSELKTHGQSMGRIIVFHDITAHKELQMMLTRMMRMAAHDLRTPLAVATGYLDILAEEPLSENGKEWLTIVSRAVKQIEHLVNELLDLERVRSGVSIRAEEFDPGALAQQAYDNLLPLASAHNQKFEIQIDSDLPKLRGDSKLLRQALVNLLSNAIKYTQEGGQIVIHVFRQGQEVLFEVSDTGRGIAQETQGLLFQPFYRSREHDDKTAGSGLGLSLVKAIVEAHHGRVWVRSEPGEGSVFGFSLPLPPHPFDDKQNRVSAPKDEQ